MTPEQIRAQNAILATNVAATRTEAIAAQVRAHIDYADTGDDGVWARAEAKEEAHLLALDLLSRGESAYVAALIERDRAAHGLAVGKYEDGSAA